ncbi:MAG: translation factor GTPase family protein [Clostridiaceae bacterium]
MKKESGVVADIKSDKRIIGILAHVDSGKTTLAEALLYQAGALRSQGRVDHGDAFLDTGAMERQRGITIFSKIARLKLGDAQGVLLDTPGHTDFSPETERALGVLDYCILVINGADGVTNQTRKLWNLLDYYEVPVFLFVNKLDQVGVDRTLIYEALQSQLSDHIQDFSRGDLLSSEDVAELAEDLLEDYLAKGSIEEDSIRVSILERKIFPCYFGSALKGSGITEFYEGLARWTMDLLYPLEFSARVYKISRDDQGRRLTHLKITGGSLKNKMTIGSEKINEIRLYSGSAFQSVQEAAAGDLCSVIGLKETRAGQGLGTGESDIAPTIIPVLSYRVKLEDGGDTTRLLALLRQIEEELPELEVTFVEATAQIFVHIMGEVLLEVLADLVQKRGAMTISVDEGSIIYRETVTRPVIGIGHFEPLRHYAEVQLLLAPADELDVTTASICDQNALAPNWQNLIMSHVLEKQHKGVLIGAPLSKVLITLVAGRAHLKHTTGGDFREATYRAIRQGLMEARAQGASTVLEPYYEFEIRTGPDTSGRILTDLAHLFAGEVSTSLTEDQQTLIKGRGPVATLRTYARELVAITHGQGQIRFEAGGYDICHNQSEVIEEAGYDVSVDLNHPSGSIFTSAGVGVYVPWHEVPQMAHLPRLALTGPVSANSSSVQVTREAGSYMDPEEVERIINSVANANANEKKKWKGRSRRKVERGQPPGTPLADPTRPTYVLVDGYNIIHAWPDLKALSDVNFDAARQKLAELLQDYQGFTGEQILLVFDAYKVAGGIGSQDHQAGVSIIYTRENETADRYIERRARELTKNFQVKVVTSDAAEQMSASGSGALIYSARRFLEILQSVSAEGMKDYERNHGQTDHLRPFAELLGHHQTDPTDKT